MNQTIRLARPTSDLDKISQMYCDGLGWEVLGHFENHDHFSGVMIGKSELDYHIEFTQEDGADFAATPTAEDLLVFYIAETDEWESRCLAMKRAGFKEVPPHNPYWDKKGMTFIDFDGYRIVIQNSNWSS